MSKSNLVGLQAIKQLLRTRFANAKSTGLQNKSPNNPSEISFGADENLDSSSAQGSLSAASRVEDAAED